MKSLFVYYKVPAAERAQVLPALDRLRLALQRDWPTLELQVMQRPDASAEGMETWMEVYTHPTGVGEEIAAAIARHAAEAGLPSRRAAEVFVPLRP